MSKFEDVVKSDTPRLEVRYRSMDGRDEFQWGTIGVIPLLTLVGDLCRVQVELHASSEWLDDSNRCVESKFILVPNEMTGIPDWFVHPEIPTSSLIGMLETIKSAVVLSLAARRVAAQGHTILGTDGRPMIH